MLVDFAQQVEHSEGLTAEESIYQACLMRSDDPDDHDGGAARWRYDDAGYGVGSEIRQPLGYASSAAWPCRRFSPLYDAGRLHLSRPAAVLDLPKKEEASASGHAEPLPAE